METSVYLEGFRLAYCDVIVPYGSPLVAATGFPDVKGDVKPPHGHRQELTISRDCFATSNSKALPQFSYELQ